MNQRLYADPILRVVKRDLIAFVSLPIQDLFIVCRCRSSFAYYFRFELASFNTPTEHGRPSRQ